jgi:hypothetical protein
LAKKFIQSFRNQSGTYLFGSRILPNDRISIWFARQFIPQHSCLTLVGYAETFDLPLINLA